MSVGSLISLEFEGKLIRMVGTADRPEWVAADVCAALGIINSSQAVGKFPAKDRGICSVDTPSGAQEMLTVTESGLWRLICKSRKPEAERVQAFIFGAVMPCIRKYGCWPAPEVLVDGNALLTVNREFMVQMGQVLHEAVFSSVQPIRDDVNILKEDVKDIRCTLNDWARRVPLTQETKNLHVRIVYNYYDGKCPCCRKVLIVGEDKKRLPRLTFDHWVRRTQSSAQDTWAVCDGCNSRFNDHNFKASNQVLFSAYQKHREQQVQAISGRQLPYMEDVG